MEVFLEGGREGSDTVRGARSATCISFSNPPADGYFPTKKHFFWLALSEEGKGRKWAKNHAFFQAGTLIKLSSSAVKGMESEEEAERNYHRRWYFFAPSFWVSVVKYAEEGGNKKSLPLCGEELWALNVCLAFLNHQKIIIFKLSRYLDWKRSLMQLEQ